MSGAAEEKMLDGASEFPLVMLTLFTFIHRVSLVVLEMEVLRGKLEPL